jgi:hypothetical protein
VRIIVVAIGQRALEICNAWMDCCKVLRPELDNDNDGIGWTTGALCRERGRERERKLKGDRERVQGGAYMVRCNGRGQEEWGGDGALTNLARRGREDKVGRDLMMTTALVRRWVLFAEREIEREREN